MGIHSLASRVFWSAALAMAVGAAARAGEPVPADKRIAATVLSTLAAPAEQRMHMPTDVAVDSQGRIFVADGANDRILRFTPDGKLDEAITEVGQHKLKRPVGITVDAQDQLWIADSGNHAIIVRDKDGKLVSGIVPLQIDASGPADPTDIVITPDGKRTYVADNDHHRVLVRDNATRQWTALGDFGRGIGQFQWPFMLAAGPDNYVYVSEAIGSRVQKISPTGKWAGELGRFGVELGQLYRPKGLVVDGQGRVFVNDSTMKVIQVFSSRGGNLGVLTDAKGNPLRFEHPMGMCFDGKSRLLVVEMTGHRVAVVELAGQVNR